MRDAILVACYATLHPALSVGQSVTFYFLVADTQLYKRLCPSVGRSVDRLVGQSVGQSGGWLVGWLVGRSPFYFFGVF